MRNPAGIDYDVMEEALRSLDGIPLPPGLKGLPPERGGESVDARRAGGGRLERPAGPPDPVRRSPAERSASQCPR